MNNFKKLMRYIIVLGAGLMVSSNLFADSKTSKTTKIKKVKVVEVKSDSAATPTKTKKNSDKLVHDFDGVSIDGEVKAPNGFMIKGRTPQKLMQMVDLRADFNNNLRNSTAGVHSLAK